MCGCILQQKKKYISCFPLIKILLKTLFLSFIHNYSRIQKIPFEKKLECVVHNKKIKKKTKNNINIYLIENHKPYNTN